MLPRPFATRAVPVALTAALLTGAACGGDDDQPETTPTITAPSTTTTTEPVPTDEEQIEALLTEWFDVVEQIFALEVPVSEADRYITGTYLSGLRGSLDLRTDEGYMIVRSDESAHKIESIDVQNDEAVALICVTDANDDISITTGEVIDDTIVSERLRDTLIRGDHGWRIERRDVLGPIESLDECDG